MCVVILYLVHSMESETNWRPNCVNPHPKNYTKYVLSDDKFISKSMSILSTKISMFLDEKVASRFFVGLYDSFESHDCQLYSRFDITFIMRYVFLFFLLFFSFPLTLCYQRSNSHLIERLPEHRN